MLRVAARCPRPRCNHCTSLQHLANDSSSLTAAVLPSCVVLAACERRSWAGAACRGATRERHQRDRALTKELERRRGEASEVSVVTR